MLAVLVGLMLAALVAAGFVSVAPNRILSGKPLAATAALPVWMFGLIALLVLGLGALAYTRRSALWQMLLGGGLFFGVLVGAGWAASAIRLASGPTTRTGLGAGFWILAVASLLVVVDGAARLRLITRLALVGAMVGGLALLLAGGLLRDLSLLREFTNRQGQFAGALMTHLQLVGLTLAVALPAGAVLGLWGRRRAGVFSGLSLLQTIPSIALFALLIGPLTSLTQHFPVLRGWGISGIGMAPAVIALALYALLPVARGVAAGLDSVPAAAIDAARGMGMSRGQMFWQVSLPLALPVLLASFRIVLVQTIGLAVVAALIGAGGLGSFVFQGLGQTATDLVLLGALSAIALALLADFALRAATTALTTRVAGR